MERQHTPKSMCETRTLTSGRLRGQDKSRNVRGGRKDDKTSNNNLLAQGAYAPVTLLNRPSHWECGDLCTLQAKTP